MAKRHEQLVRDPKHQKRNGNLEQHGSQKASINFDEASPTMAVMALYLCNSCSLCPHPSEVKNDVALRD
jgi:hypothetical protein